jgi:hypothetical protein
VTAVENPHAGLGAVVLDIGGDVGALLLSAPAELAGAEIEICPAGCRNGAPDEGGDWWDGQWRSHSHGAESRSHSHGAESRSHSHGAAGGQPGHHGPSWPHVAVLGRRTPTGTRYGAVFPGLRSGCYELWRRPDGPTTLALEVIGGRVTTATWP